MRYRRQKRVLSIELVFGFFVGAWFLGKTVAGSLKKRLKRAKGDEPTEESSE